MQAVSLDYTPQPRQALLHATPARLILYGGAVGGGKSHALRWEAISWALQVPGIQVYLFRRTLGELEDNHVRQLKDSLSPLHGHVGYNETRKTFEFKNGSTIRLCYCEKEHDVERYQGAEIHVLLVDEAGHLTEYQLNYLVGRNRLGGFAEKVAEELRHMLPRAVFSSNPGGPGHQFLKQCFVEPAEEGVEFRNQRYRDPRDPNDPGRLSIYIPARMKDNKFIDSDYGASLAGLPPELARALRDGDWDAVVGQALHTLAREKHMLRPFTPPRHWTRFMSLDWGTAKPFSVGWYTVSDGGILEGKEAWPERWLPPGAVIRYAEWYGWNGNADQGARLDSRTVAKRILEIEKERGEPPIDYRIGDTAMWAVHDGISIAHNMMEATEGRLQLTPAKKSREQNYNEILCRLAGSENYLTDGRDGDAPMFYATADCTHFWRTVPTLILDGTNPEKGPDSSQEDHVFDDVSYALRSRPFMTTELDRYMAAHGNEMREAKRGGRSSDPYATR